MRACGVRVLQSVSVRHLGGLLQQTRGHPRQLARRRSHVHRVHRVSPWPRLVRALACVRTTLHTSKHHACGWRGFEVWRLTRMCSLAGMSRTFASPVELGCKQKQLKASGFSHRHACITKQNKSNILQRLHTGQASVIAMAVRIRSRGAAHCALARPRMPVGPCRISPSLGGAAQNNVIVVVGGRRAAAPGHRVCPRGMDDETFPRCETTCAGRCA